MTLKFKPGVKLAGLTPQMALAAFVVTSVYEELGATCTITSANDSTHSKRSFHYKGAALDFRTRDFTGDKYALLEAIEKALGQEFDCLLESVDTPNQHIHVEWDPD